MRYPHLFIIATAMISGVAVFINSFGVAIGDSAVYTFAKNVVVAVMLAALLLATAKRRELAMLAHRDWLALAGIGLVGGSIPFLLFFRGLQLTTGATSAFIHKLVFVFAALFALALLRERLNPIAIAGAALLIGGTYLFLAPQLTLQAGHLLVLSATIMWAFENVWAKHLLRRLSSPVVAFARMGFGSLFILGYLVASGKAPLLASITSAQLGWSLLASALLFGYVTTYYAGLARVRVSSATAILTLGAPITALLSWLFTDAQLVLGDLVSIVVMLAGACAIAWSAPLWARLRTFHHARP